MRNPSPEEWALTAPTPTDEEALEQELEDPFWRAFLGLPDPDQEVPVDLIIRLPDQPNDKETTQ